MKNIGLLILLLLSFKVYSQVLIDSIAELGLSPVTSFFPATEHGASNIYVCHIDGNSTDPIILNYSQYLNIIDTITGVDANRPRARFFYPFKFNNGLYYLCTGHDSTSLRKYSYHKLENGAFTDSLGLNLDSLHTTYPSLATALDDNTLQILLTIKPDGSPIIGSRVLYLDSNFHFKSYHSFNLDSLSPFTREVTAIHHINDSIWHLYLYNTLVVYNHKKRHVNNINLIKAKVYDTYNLPNQKYIALGVISAVFEAPQSGGNIATAVGFYTINAMGQIIDTVQFNAFRDTVPQFGFSNYSDESVIGTNQNSIVYDTNNIIIASSGDYTPFTSNVDIQYFYVVKTDLQGSLKWQFTWGGQDNLTSFNGIASTLDKGCVISGTIKRANGNRYALLIKLGPDGNISNVELDAPETVVSFYPNPVKDQLHYSFLPEAKGPYTLEIIDMQGKPVLEKTLDSEKGFVPVQLHAGFYLYNLIDNDGKVQQVGKMLVNN